MAISCVRVHVIKQFVQLEGRKKSKNRGKVVRHEDFDGKGGKKERLSTETRKEPAEG